MKTIFIDYSRLVTSMMILENGVLDNLFFSFSSLERNIGNIYCAKVVNLCDGLGCVFLDIGGRAAFMEYKPESYNYGLLRTDIAKPLQVGDLVLVRLSKEAVQDKVEKVALDMTLAGRTLVLIDAKREILFSSKLEKDEHILALAQGLASEKDDNVGFIIRTQAKGYPIDYILNEAKELTRQYYEVISNFAAQKTPRVLYFEEDLVKVKFRDIICKDDKIEAVWVNSKKYYNYLNDLQAVELPNLQGKVNLYQGVRTMYTNFNLGEHINTVAYNTVPLKNGGNLIIEKTKALVTIDVNSAHFICSNIEETAYETNKAAAEEIARQIRLRDLSGIIIVDFIDMKEAKSKEKLVELLEKYTADDFSTVKVLGITQLGLCEMTRERVRCGMERIATKSCPYCQGRGDVASDLLVAYIINCALCDLIDETNAKEIGIHINENLLAYVQEDKFFQDYFKTCVFGVNIYLIAEQNCRHDYYRFNLSLSLEEKKNAWLCCGKA